MLSSDYDFYASIAASDGGYTGDVPLDVDWVPSVRLAEFEWSVLLTSPVAAKPGPVAIKPVWSSTAAAPFVDQVVITRNGDDDAGVVIPRSYFADAVTAASMSLVASGALVAGQLFDYRIYALATQRQPVPAIPEIKVVALDTTPAITTAAMAPLLGDNRLEGTGAIPSPGRGASPVFIPQWLLDEMDDHGRKAGEVETGGILLGKLGRDPDGTLYSQVTAQIPAVNAIATRESLRFAPETWTSVRAAIDLRDRNETPLGWWHTHPYFCRNCTAAQRALCPLSSPAFSVADRALHREVFQAPWSIALLLSYFEAPRSSYDLFAWNAGQIDAVPFHVLP